MSQSIYTRTETETPHGVLRLRSGGIMALRAGTLEMDTIFRGWVNAWGHQFDAYGQSFVTDGAGGDLATPASSEKGNRQDRLKVGGQRAQDSPVFVRLEKALAGILFGQ